ATVALAPRAIDEEPELGVDLGARADVLAPRVPGAEIALEEADHHPRLGRRVERARERVAEPIELGALGAEDRAEDDLERDALRELVEGEGAIARDLGDGLLRDRLHRLAVVEERVAAEGRGEEATLAPVPLSVEEDHAVLAEEGLEHRVGLARAEDVRIARDEVADGVGLGVDDERRRAGQPHGEGRAVSRLARREELPWRDDEARELHGRRQERARRKPAVPVAIDELL